MEYHQSTHMGLWNLHLHTGAPDRVHKGNIIPCHVPKHPHPGWNTSCQSFAIPGFLQHLPLKTEGAKKAEETRANQAAV